MTFKVQEAESNFFMPRGKPDSDGKEYIVEHCLRFVKPDSYWISSYIEHPSEPQQIARQSLLSCLQHLDAS